MLKQKKEWPWLALAALTVLMVISLTSCDLKQAEYQNEHKLLVFQFRDSVVQDWNQSSKAGIGMIGIRVDGAIRMVKPSSYRFGSTKFSSMVTDGSGSYYYLKQSSISVEELIELKNLVTAAEKTRWEDKECNVSSVGRNNIQIDFYDQDKKVNRIEICFLRGDDLATQHLPSDLPENVAQLVNKLIDIKDSFEDSSWSKHEVKDPLNWDWWLGKKQQLE